VTSDRDRLTPYPRLIALLARLGLRSIARVRVEGVHDLPTSGPLIIAANHMSNADPPLIGGWLAPALGRRPTFLAKEALFVGPVGLLIRSLGAEPVKAGGSDIGAYRAAKAILDRGGVVAILPEGTRSFDGVLAEPKPGVSLLATRTGAPVLPVGISGTDTLLGRGRTLPAIGTRVTMRVGRPFRLTIPVGTDRRAALAAADAELMRRIAALVDPRHRGGWEPWADE
jgi:1-acyl-sn-glycerol-3-phosphate acyltransferase